MSANRGTFADRRTRFDAAIQAAGPWLPFGPCTCPCCGFPTLYRYGDYDVCALCAWEDDGQDDPEADVAWGGPNGDYSLTEARTRFDEAGGRHGMYRPDDLPAVLNENWPLRSALMDALLGWLDAGETRSVDVIERLANAVLDRHRVWYEDLPRLPPPRPESPDFSRLPDLPDPAGLMIDASIVLCTTRELLKSLPVESWRSAEALIAKYAARIARLDPETFRLMPAFRDLRLPPADSPWILAYTRAVGPVLYPRVEAAYLAACPPVEAEIERRKRAGLPPYDREGSA